jgi:hypothetical protein
LALVVSVDFPFLHRRTNPEIERPVRLPDGMHWLALALGIFLTFLWAYGGWNSPSVVVGAKDPSLFFLGLAAIGAYLPLHAWRRFTDRRLGGGPKVVDVTDLAPTPQPGVPAGQVPAADIVPVAQSPET